MKGCDKLNKSKILFLKMFLGDIKRYACDNVGIDPSNLSDTSLLTGQTIKKSVIESFSSYKLMNEEERKIVNSILNGIKNDKSGKENGKALLKHIDSLVPKSTELVDYKDAV